MPEVEPPAIWFPYGRMGQSVSEPIWDTTGGKFGPFAGQCFVGDQMKAIVMRVVLEKVNGVWQPCNTVPFDWRSYGMYGFLAGVRNYSAVQPISEPRGFPEDANSTIQARPIACQYHAVASTAICRSSTRFSLRIVARQTARAMTPTIRCAACSPVMM